MPRAADVGVALEHDEVGPAGAQQRDRHADAAEAATDDRDVDVVGEVRRPALALDHPDIVAQDPVGALHR